jgi:ADP-ribosylarginine hydrolase
MFEDFEYVHEYVKQGRDYKEYRKSNYEYFEEEWKKYLKKRGLLADDPSPIFPENFGIKERDKFYKSVSFDGW